MYLLVKISAIFLIIYLINKAVNRPATIKGWSFKGPVENVWYTEKGIPSVLIHGTEYNLDYMIWHFDDIIHVGDTIIKRKGDLRLRLIRRNTKDTVFYNSLDDD